MYAYSDGSLNARCITVRGSRGKTKDMNKDIHVNVFDYILTDRTHVEVNIVGNIFII